MFRTVTAAALFALTTVSAQAGSVDVSFKDLNLANPADALVMARRVADAAEKACGPVAYTSDLRPSARSAAESDHRACVRYVSEKAMAQVQAVQTRLAGGSRARLARD